MASGANIAAFNIGNALGAWLGGLAIGAGFGFVSPLWVGAGVTAVGLVVLLGGSVRPRRAVAGGSRAGAGGRGLTRWTRSDARAGSFGRG